MKVEISRISELEVREIVDHCRRTAQLDSAAGADFEIEIITSDETRTRPVNLTFDERLTGGYCIISPPPVQIWLMPEMGELATRQKLIRELTHAFLGTLAFHDNTFRRLLAMIQFSWKNWGADPWGYLFPELEGYITIEVDPSIGFDQLDAVTHAELDSYREEAKRLIASADREDVD